MNLNRLKKLSEELKKLNEAVERYLSVEPCEGGFIPNTDVEYDAEIILKEGNNVIDSIMISLDGQTNKEIRDIAADHFPNITNDIRVEWNI